MKEFSPFLFLSKVTVSFIKVAKSGEKHVKFSMVLSCPNSKHAKRINKSPKGEIGGVLRGKL